MAKKYEYPYGLYEELCQIPTYRRTIVYAYFFLWRTCDNNQPEINQTILTISSYGQQPCGS